MRRVGLLLLALALSPDQAKADDAPPPIFTSTLRDILDGCAIASSSYPKPVSLNRGQLAATLAGDRLGLPGMAVKA